MTTMSKTRAEVNLSKTDFFADFPIDVLEQIEKDSTVRKFRKNSHIILNGEESHAAYVVISGSANAFADNEEGGEFSVSSFSEGDCFGELGVMSSGERSANVVTTSDCECLVIPKAVFMRALRSNQSASDAVIQHLIKRIRGMTEEVSCLALMDVYGRLVRILRLSAEKISDDGKTTERMTHKEIANRVGSSREMISKILKDLRVGGYIDIVDHRIMLLKELPERW